MYLVQIKGKKLSLEDVKNIEHGYAQNLLSQVYKRHTERPKCLCCSEAPELQIKRIRGKYHVAKMPANGLEHAESCPFYGEPEHRTHHQEVDQISLNISLTLDRHATHDGDVTLAGLLNTLWTRAKLNQWTQYNNSRNWKYVAQRLHSASRNLKLNNTSTSQCLWIMPHMDEANALQVRDDCLNFVKSCYDNQRCGIIIAPIGTSEFQNHASCLRFRGIEKPPVFIEYRKFPYKTAWLRPSPDCPYPVAIILVKSVPDKAYLRGEEIAMLWMTRGYLPLVCKDRAQLVTEHIGRSFFLKVPLDCVSGAILKDVLTYKDADGYHNIVGDIPIEQLPWNK